MSFIGQKTPTEVLDFTISWVDVLVADTISSSSWVIGAGLTAGSTSNTTTTATTFVSGGTAGGAPVELTNTIVTAASRTHTRTISVAVIAKKYE